jgi:hypothetical protein
VISLLEVFRLSIITTVYRIWLRDVSGVSYFDSVVPVTSLRWLRDVSGISYFDSVVPVTSLSWLRDVSGISYFDSVVPVTSLRWTPRCQWHLLFWLCGASDILTLTPRCQWHLLFWLWGANDILMLTLQCQWHLLVRLLTANDISNFDSAVSTASLNLPPWRQWQFYVCSVGRTVEQICEYLNYYAADWKDILIWISVPLGVLSDYKNRGWKSRKTIRFFYLVLTAVHNVSFLAFQFAVFNNLLYI